MKAPRFEYEKPKTLDAALALLAQGGDAKVLAGGQSLGPLLNLRLAQPDLLVDVRGLSELTQVQDDADAVTLGACVTHAAIEDGRVPDPSRGLFARVARGIAYRAVRNRGTLGGSLAHADPAADWVSVMALLDATLLIRSRSGERRLPAASFMTGPLTTRLAPGEVIVALRVPKLSQGARAGYFKFNRKPGEFAEAIGALLDDPQRGIRRAVIGATASAPFVVADATGLTGPADEAQIHGAVTSAGFVPGTYEHRVHAVALQRAAARLQ
jgi:aerobic carbon-monoxide dehydrogenase medium subunit